MTKTAPLITTGQQLEQLEPLTTLIDVFGMAWQVIYVENVKSNRGFLLAGSSTTFQPSGMRQLFPFRVVDDGSYYLSTRP